MTTVRQIHVQVSIEHSIEAALRVSCLLTATSHGRRALFTVISNPTLSARVARAVARYVASGHDPSARHMGRLVHAITAWAEEV